MGKRTTGDEWAKRARPLPTDPRWSEEQLPLDQPAEAHEATENETQRREWHPFPNWREFPHEVFASFVVWGLAFTQ